MSHHRSSSPAITGNYNNSDHESEYHRRRASAAPVASPTSSRHDRNRHQLQNYCHRDRDRDRDDRPTQPQRLIDHWQEQKQQQCSIIKSVDNRNCTGDPDADFGSIGSDSSLKISRDNTKEKSASIKSRPGLIDRFASRHRGKSYASLEEDREDQSQDLSIDPNTFGIMTENRVTSGSASDKSDQNSDQHNRAIVESNDNSASVAMTGPTGDIGALVIPGEDDRKSHNNGNRLVQRRRSSGIRARSRSVGDAVMSWVSQQHRTNKNDSNRLGQQQQICVHPPGPKCPGDQSEGHYLLRSFLVDASGKLVFKDKAAFDYGTSIPPTTEVEDQGTKKIIFCVHGKLSGCCKVVKGSTGDDNIIRDYRDNSGSYEDHCHRERDEEVDKKARKKLIIASILCVLFMVMEIIGGYLSNSLSVATDAAHLLTDFASFMISLFSIWLASRPATRKMPFGWYRAEVIGALTSVLMIWVVTGILFYLAVDRVIHDEFQIDPLMMLITSGIGVAINLVMGLTLHQHGGHSHGGHDHGHDHHGHGHSHNHHGKENGHANNHNHANAAEKAENGRTPQIKSHEEVQRNINVRAAFVHVLGDFIQSTGVLVAALIIYFKPEWKIVDPICTFLFSIMVMLTTIAIIKDVINVLMEGIPKGFDYSQVENTFVQIDGIVKVHNLRIWALSLDKPALSAHLAIRPGFDPQNILRTATRNIHEKYNFFEMTLQIEEFDERMDNCKQCKPPQQ